MDPSQDVPIVDGTDAKESGLLSQSAIEFQQRYFEDISGDWVKYEKKNYNHLLQKIAFAFYGMPQNEEELNDVSEGSNFELHGYNSRQKEHVMKIFEKVREQSKYSLNSEDILVSVLFVVCVKPRPLPFFKKEPADHWVDLHDRTDVDLWVTPVFRVRKCIPPITLVDESQNNQKAVPSCKIYIDENARVYQDWESYLTNNTLPKCVMVVPTGGEYKGAITDEKAETVAVLLSVVPSPALGLKARVLSRADTVSTVAAVGSIGLLGVAMLPVVAPAAPLLLAGAGVATVATGLYGLARSSLHLHDRTQHEQSISVTDAEARNSWINIAASSVGLTASAAASLLSKSAAAGTNMTTTGIALTKSVTVLRHATLVSGGAGMLNGLVHMISKYRKHGETPTSLEVFQFSMSALFFFNAAMTSKTAQDIIKESQATTINEYRASLRSNRHRKIFDKVSAETRRVAGHATGNTEVIQCIRNIRDKDQFFADVLRMNKASARNGVRISVTSDGQVNLNAQHKFHPSQLSTLDTKTRVDLYKQLSPADLSTPNVPTRLPPTDIRVASYGAGEEEKPTTVVNIRPEEILQLGRLAFSLTSAGSAHIAEKLQNLTEEAHVNLIQIATGVLSKLIPTEIQKLKIFTQDRDLLEEVVDFVFKYLKHQRPLGEQSADDSDIVVVLKQFFQDGKVRADTLISLKDNFVSYINGEIDARGAQYNKTSVVCTRCGGFYFVAMPRKRVN